ncbi:MAG TPA: MFS transporter, partial [Actinomycetota bacterium]|nr:MFS transporter [Actinomycetota bacterium]
MKQNPRGGRARPSVFSRTFRLVMFSTFAYFTAVGVIIPVLPRFVEGPLRGGSVAVGLAMGAFALTAVVLRPFVGRISDRRGRTILIIGGGLLMGASTAAYALISDLEMLLVLRLVTGVGEAGFYVGVASIVNDLAPEERRGETLSYFSLALFGGLATGPVLGEWLLVSSGFTATWLVAGASACVAGVVGLVLPDTRPPGTSEQASRLIHPAALKPGTILATHIWALATFTSFVPLYALSLGMGGSRYVFAMHSIIVLAIRSLGARLPDILGPRLSARLALICGSIGLPVMGFW